MVTTLAPGGLSGQRLTLRRRAAGGSLPSTAPAGPRRILRLPACASRATPTTLVARAATLLHEARAPNTHTVDRTVRQHFATYCLATHREPKLRHCLKGTPAFAVQESTLNEFVAYLDSRGLRAASCKTYLTSLGAQCTATLGYNPLRNHQGYRLCIKGLRRIQARTVRGGTHADTSKLPLTIDVLRRGLRNAPGISVQMRALVTTGVCFMLRVSELIPCDGTSHFLRRRDVTFGPIDPRTRLPTYVRLCIPSSKTEMIPAWRHLAANQATTCVVAALSAYIGSRPDLRANAPLFSSQAGGPISRTDVTATLQTIATAAGVDPSRISAHSMRRGGATTLAQTGTIPGHMVQKHGRWATDTWLHIYQTLTDKSAAVLGRAFA